MKPGRVLHRRDGARQRVVEQLAEPTGGGHAVDLDAVGCVKAAEPQVSPQQLGGIRLALGADRCHQGGHPVGVDLHPLAAYSHQFRLGGGGRLQTLEVGLGQLERAQRRLPAEGNQGLEAEPRLGDHAGRARRLGSEAELGAGGPPRRQQHRHAHLGQWLDPLGDGQHRRGVDAEFGRGGLVEHRRQLWGQTHCPAQLTEQLGDAIGSEHRAVIPQVGQRDQQAGFLGILGQQL